MVRPAVTRRDDVEHVLPLMLCAGLLLEQTIVVEQLCEFLPAHEPPLGGDGAELCVDFRIVDAIAVLVVRVLIVVAHQVIHFPLQRCYL